MHDQPQDPMNKEDLLPSLFDTDIQDDKSDAIAFNLFTHLKHDTPECISQGEDTEEHRVPDKYITVKV